MIMEAESECEKDDESVAESESDDKTEDECESEKLEKRIIIPAKGKCGGLADPRDCTC